MATRVIGLTGGIASGKSTVAAILRELGARVVDADRLARQVVAPGEPAYQEIVEELGPGVVLPSGELDRKAIASQVFSDPARRKRLEAITHPRIAQAAQEETARHIAAGAEVVIYEAALLVENGIHKGLGGLIVVTAPPEVQIRRAMERDGLSEEEARARLQAQLPLEQKVAVADWVIDNSGSLDELRARTEGVWKKVQQG